MSGRRNYRSEVNLAQVPILGTQPPCTGRSRNYRSEVNLAQATWIPSADVPLAAPQLSERGEPRSSIRHVATPRLQALAAIIGSEVNLAQDNRYTGDDSDVLAAIIGAR